MKKHAKEDRILDDPFLKETKELNEKVSRMKKPNYKLYNQKVNKQKSSINK